MTSEPFSQADVRGAKPMIVPPFLVAPGEEPIEILRIDDRIPDINEAELVAPFEVIDANLDNDFRQGGHGRRTSKTSPQRGHLNVISSTMISGWNPQKKQDGKMKVIVGPTSRSRSESR